MTIPIYMKALCWISVHVFGFCTGSSTLVLLWKSFVCYVMPDVRNSLSTHKSEGGATVPSYGCLPTGANWALVTPHSTTGSPSFVRHLPEAGRMTAPGEWTRTTPVGIRYGGMSSADRRAMKYGMCYVGDVTSLADDSTIALCPR